MHIWSAFLCRIGQFCAKPCILLSVEPCIFVSNRAILSRTSVVMSYYYTLTTNHYSDVIMGAMASQITSLTIVYSTVYSDADQGQHQNAASLAFVRGIHRWPVNSPHKWPVTFPFGFHLMTSSWQSYSEDSWLADKQVLFFSKERKFWESDTPNRRQAIARTNVDTAPSWRIHTSPTALMCWLCGNDK